MVLGQNEQMTATEVRVVVAHQDSLLRDALAGSLARTHVDLVAAFSSLPELSAACVPGAVDVALVSVDLPGGDLSAAIATLIGRGTRSIVLATDDLDERGTQLLLAGAAGFLLTRDLSVATVIDHVRAVHAGRTALHPSVAVAVLDQWRAMRERVAPQTSAPPERPAATLTPREQQVLEGLSEGLTTHTISARLGVSYKTVESHKSRLYAKLGARNQAHAVRLAIANGLLGAGAGGGLARCAKQPVIGGAAQVEPAPAGRPVYRHRFGPPAAESADVDRDVHERVPVGRRRVHLVDVEGQLVHGSDLRDGRRDILLALGVLHVWSSSHCCGGVSTPSS